MRRLAGFQLLVSAAVCALALIVPTAALAAEISFCDFGNANQLQNLQLNGGAVTQNGVLRLTPSDTFGETGSAYLKTPFPLTASTSFETHFVFRMHANTGASGGAGLAFVLQNDGTTALGADGSKMGLDGVTPSIAVELDTSQDAGDPNANHVGILVSGTTIATAALPFNAKNGTATDVWIEYDATTKTLAVYASQGTGKPATALLASTLEVYTAIDAVGAGNSVLVGFSAGTSATTKNDHDILFWELGSLKLDDFPDPSGLPACPATLQDGSSCDCKNTPGLTCGRRCNSQSSCTVVSRANKTATFRCNSASSCSIYCEPGSICDIECNSSNCAIRCSAGSTCNTFCNSASCGLTCEPGSTCVNSFNSTNPAVVNCPAGATCNNVFCNSTNCTMHCAPGSCTFAGGCDSCGKTTTPGGGNCVGCVSDGQCVATPSTPACQPSGFCGECSAGNTTRCAPPLGVCDVLGGTCVECNTNEQCTGNTPICHNHQCVPCENDLGGAAPACSNPTAPACQHNGPLAGSCTECSPTNATLCVQPAPVCLTSGTCGCTTDADCGGAGSGLICTGTPATCVPGCRPAGGATTCPAGQICQATADPTVGTCVAQCTTDAQCVAPTPNCLVVGAGGTCVQCVDDPDCAGNPAGPLCAPNNTCGECTPTNTTACDPAGQGGACRPNGQCGCNTDADCGGTSSGRICSDTTKTCIAGCRGTGGNGCPTGDKCTSTTTAPGQCVTDPNPDGGADSGAPDAGTDGGDGGGDGGVTDAGSADAGGGGATSDGGGSDDGGKATPTDEFSIEGAGCACNAPGNGGSLPPWGGLGAGALAVMAFMRRRRSVRSLD